MCKVMRLFVKSILSVLFFHFCSIFRQKRRPSSRFLPFQAVYFETIDSSPACAKSCATLVPTTCEIGANLSQTSSVFSATSSVFFAASSVFSVTSSVFFADSLPLLRRILRLLCRFIRLDRHILHLAAAPIQLLRRSGCLARHSDPPVRHRANLARYQLYVDFRA